MVFDISWVLLPYKMVDFLYTLNILSLICLHICQILHIDCSRPNAETEPVIHIYFCAANYYYTGEIAEVVYVLVWRPYNILSSGFVSLLLTVLVFLIFISGLTSRSRLSKSFNFACMLHMLCSFSKYSIWFEKLHVFPLFYIQTTLHISSSTIVSSQGDRGILVLLQY